MSYRNQTPVGDTNIEYEPVQFEGPYSLTGCTLTDGRGLLVWQYGQTDVRFAIVDTPAEWLADGVVTSATTALTVPAHAMSGVACFMANGLPHFTVGWTSSSVGHVEIYQGNSGSNPTTWTLHGTVQYDADDRSNGSHPTFDAQHGQKTAGIPYINGDDWVLGTAHWGPGLAVNTAHTRGAVYYSDDGGVTWSERVERSFGTGGRFTNMISPHIARDPATGYLYWMVGSDISGSDPDTCQWLESQDGGPTWATIQNVGPSNFFSPYTDYDGSPYALTSLHSSSTAFTHKLTDPGADATARSLFGSHLGVSQNSHLCIGGEYLYLFSNQTVQAAVGRGPYIVRIGFG